MSRVSATIAQHDDQTQLSFTGTRTRSDRSTRPPSHTRPCRLRAFPARRPPPQSNSAPSGWPSRSQGCTPHTARPIPRDQSPEPTPASPSQPQTENVSPPEKAAAPPNPATLANTTSKQAIELKSTLAPTATEKADPLSTGVLDTSYDHFSDAFGPSSCPIASVYKNRTNLDDSLIELTIPKQTLGNHVWYVWVPRHFQTNKNDQARGLRCIVPPLAEGY